MTILTFKRLVLFSALMVLWTTQVASTPYAIDISFNYQRPLYFNNQLRAMGFDSLPDSSSISSESVLVKCFHASYRMYINGVTQASTSPLWKEYRGIAYLRYSMFKTPLLRKEK